MMSKVTTMSSPLLPPGAETPDTIYFSLSYLLFTNDQILRAFYIMCDNNTARIAQMLLSVIFYCQVTIILILVNIGSK